MLSKQSLDQTESMLKRTGLTRDNDAPSPAFSLARLARDALAQYRENPSANAELLIERLSQVMTHNPNLYELYHDVLQPALLAEMAALENAAVKPAPFAANVQSNDTLNEDLLRALRAELLPVGSAVERGNLLKETASEALDTYLEQLKEAEGKPAAYKAVVEKHVAGTAKGLRTLLGKLATEFPESAAVFEAAMVPLTPQQYRA